MINYAPIWYRNAVAMLTGEISYVVNALEVLLAIVVQGTMASSIVFGGGYRTRTDHLQLAKLPLSQMS